MSSQPARTRRPSLLIAVLALGVTSGDLHAQQTPGRSGAAAEELRLSIDNALTRARELVVGLEDDTLPVEQQQTAYSDATRLVKYVQELDPLNARAQFLLGRLSILANRPREALGYIEAYLRDDQGKNDWLAHKLVGDLYVVSYPKLATAEYRRAIELAADEPDAHVGLARAYLKLNEPEDAVASARRAIQLDRDNTAAYRAVLARGFLARSEQVDEAIQAAREAVEMMEQQVRESPGKLELLMELKEYYNLLNNCYAKLVELYPDRPAGAVDRARTWQDLADLNRLIDYCSIRSFIEGQRSNPQLAAAPALMLEEARLNWMLGANDRAVELAQQVLELDADNQAARELLDAIRPPDAAEGENATAADQPDPPDAS